MENTSALPHLDVPTVSEAELRRVRTYGDLVWADKFLFAYKYRDKIYIMEPPQDLFDQVCDLIEDHPLYRVGEDGSVRVELEEEFEFDPAVIMHTIHEMAYALKEVCDAHDSRHYKPRTIIEARELLADYYEEYGVDFDRQENLKVDQNMKLGIGK